MAGVADAMLRNIMALGASTAIQSSFRCTVHPNHPLIEAPVVNVCRVTILLGNFEDLKVQMRLPPSMSLVLLRWNQSTGMASKRKTK